MAANKLRSSSANPEEPSVTMHVRLTQSEAGPFLAIFTGVKVRILCSNSTPLAKYNTTPNRYPSAALSTTYNGRISGLQTPHGLVEQHALPPQPLLHVCNFDGTCVLF